jgi:predicted nuclease of predicted toxin-antitoxin system
MKFLIDAQLPRALTAHFRKAGLEAIHTLDLPDGNSTTDQTLNELSTKEQYIVVTKDSDFVESFLLHHRPWKLLLVSTGNINNKELQKLFLSNMQRLIEGFEGYRFIELNQTSMIFHL